MLNAAIHRHHSLMLNHATKTNKRTGISATDVTQTHFGKALPRVLIAIAAVIKASGSTKRTLSVVPRSHTVRGLDRCKGLKASKGG